MTRKVQPDFDEVFWMGTFVEMRSTFWSDPHHSPGAGLIHRSTSVDHIVALPFVKFYTFLGDQVTG